MQNRRGVLFLVLAIALGVGAALIAQRWLESQRVAEVATPRSATQPVSVARQGLAVGSVLHPRELTTVEWPSQYVPQGTFGSPQELDGRVLRRPMAAGEPVLETALLPVGAQGGLVSVIDPTLRAVSVKVDPVVGVAGFVVPGSWVDVIVTVKRSDRQAATKAVLQDVQVLAIDQKLEEAEKGDPQLVSVVTLAVSTEQAEKLTFASHEGKLQLALRNPSDREQVVTHSVGATDVLGDRRPVVARRASSSPAYRPSVEVIKGAERSVKTF